TARWSGTSRGEIRKKRHPRGGTPGAESPCTTASLGQSPPKAIRDECEQNPKVLRGPVRRGVGRSGAHRWGARVGANTGTVRNAAAGRAKGAPRPSRDAPSVRSVGPRGRRNRSATSAAADDRLLDLDVGVRVLHELLEVHVHRRRVVTRGLEQPLRLLE